MKLPFTALVADYIQFNGTAADDVARLVSHEGVSDEVKEDSLSRLLGSAYAQGHITASRAHAAQMERVMSENTTRFREAWEANWRERHRAARWVAALPGIYKLAVVGVGASLAFALGSVWPLVAALPLLWFGPKGGES